MGGSRLRSSALALSLLLGGCRSPGHAPEGGHAHSDSPGDTAAPGPLVHHVLVLVLDGLRTSESFGDGVSDVTGGPTADILPEIRARVLTTGTRVRDAYA